CGAVSTSIRCPRRVRVRWIASIVDCVSARMGRLQFIRIRSRVLPRGKAYGKGIAPAVAIGGQPPNPEVFGQRRREGAGILIGSATPKGGVGAVSVAARRRSPSGPFR